jgi:hypothetical protein
MPVPLQRTGAVKFRNGSDRVKTNKQSISGVLEGAISGGRSPQASQQKSQTSYHQSGLGSSSGQYDLKYKQNLANQFNSQQGNKSSNVSNHQNKPSKSSIKTTPHEFNSDMMVSDWQSENKQSYNKNGGDYNYTDNNQSNHQQMNNFDDQLFDNGHHSKHSNNRNVMSESARQYPWPNMTEVVLFSTLFHIPPNLCPCLPQRVSAAQAPASRDPLLRGVYDEDMWRSEYEQRCASLKARQRELLQGTEEITTAGVKSAAHGEMPRNYAWEGVEIGHKKDGGGNGGSCFDCLGIVLDFIVH